MKNMVLQEKQKEIKQRNSMRPSGWCEEGHNFRKEESKCKARGGWEGETLY